jgi:hypothetical protein
MGLLLGGLGAATGQQKLRQDHKRHGKDEDEGADRVDPGLT